MTAYYNENDAFSAAWLRELIKAGLIADGEVDTRSIEDVIPVELAGFTQCHFFAGIGVWSYALRCAGWPDERPAWTGSCPCQPFSAAGQRAGVADKRHLWPAWFWLIEQCKPERVFGEQVASGGASAWLDLVCDDMEGAGYSVEAVDLPACSVGAPHIRQRLWFVADIERYGRSTWSTPKSRRKGWASLAGNAGNLGNSIGAGLEAGQGVGRDDGTQQQAIERAGGSELEHSASEQMGIPGQPREPRATNGFWANVEWIPCSDGKARPVMPGISVLASGYPARVALLRGLGNSIVAPLAEAFVRAYMETGV